MGFKSKKINKAFAALLSTLFLLTFVTTYTTPVYAKAPTDDATLQEVRDFLRTDYVDELPDDILNLPTVDAIIEAINKTDPHTKYFSANEFTDFVNSIDNKFSGIGVQIEFVPDGVQVITVFDGSPAKGAGIKPGDVIMMADSHLLGGIPDDVALSYIKGPEGTTVKLKVKRGTELLSFDIMRKQISVPTVEGKILDNHTGYIRIVTFGADTGLKFGTILAQQQAKNVDSYIVDLRNNGGGYLDVALDIAGYFIGKNNALITKSRLYGDEENFAIDHTNVIDKPIIFLINGYSASASEVLSGAVKDYGKAYFVGMKSYGKGSVQITPELSNKDHLKLTIAKFYSPKGNEINKVGIQPNLEVPDKIDSMRVAELLLDSPKEAAITNTNGYVKIETNGKTAIVKLSRIYAKDYWAAYGQLLVDAAKAGKVMIGNANGKGWTVASEAQLADRAKLIYPSYKLVAKLKNFDISSPITVKFSAKITRNSLNAKNTELIDAETGDRIAVGFTGYKDKEVTVVPKKALTNAKNYYLVVHPNLVKADKKALGIGMLTEITTVAK